MLASEVAGFGFGLLARSGQHSAPPGAQSDLRDAVLQDYRATNRKPPNKAFPTALLQIRRFISGNWFGTVLYLTH